MKKSISIILFCFLFSLSFAQKKEDIIGNWELVKFSSNEFTIDFENYEESKKEAINKILGFNIEENNILKLNDSMINSMYDLSISLIKSIKFNFNTNGSFTAYFINNIEGKFSYKNSIISLRTKESKKTIKLNLKLENEILILSQVDYEKKDSIFYFRKK